MARQTGIIRISGKVGNTVGFARGGEEFTRATAKPYDLAEESKKSATEFGRGSTASSLVREAFSRMLLPAFRKDPNNRLAEKFRRVIRSGPSSKKGKRGVFDGNVSLLNGFEFNPYTAFKKLAFFQPKAELTAKAINLSVPEFSWQRDVQAPEKATSLILGAICGSFDFRMNRYETIQAAELIIEKGQSFAGAGLQVPIPEAEEQVILVMLTLNFASTGGKNLLKIERRDAQAGTILAALHLKNGELVVFEEEALFPEYHTQPVVPVVNWQVNNSSGHLQ